MTKLKAVLFDLDETLIDWQKRSISWEDYEYDNLGRVFDYINQHVHPLSNREQFFNDTINLVVEAWAQAKQTLLAPHIGDIIQTALIQQGVPKEIIPLKACLDAYTPTMMDGVRPFEDALPSLDYLTRCQIRLGLVTNSLHPMSMRQRELDAFGLSTYLKPEVCFSAADVGYLKPHPTIFQTALAALDVKPHEAVFVGDNLRADIAGAKQVGMKAALRLRETALAYQQPMSDENEIFPDASIHRLDELFALFDTWYPKWRQNEE